MSNSNPTKFYKKAAARRRDSNPQSVWLFQVPCHTYPLSGERRTAYQTRRDLNPQRPPLSGALPIELRICCRFPPSRRRLPTKIQATQVYHISREKSNGLRTKKRAAISATRFLVSALPVGETLFSSMLFSPSGLAVVAPTVVDQISVNTMIRLGCIELPS